MTTPPSHPAAARSGETAPGAAEPGVTARDAAGAVAAPPGAAGSGGVLPGPAPSTGSPDGRVFVFGVRHHGPGSARAVRRELERLRPDVVLIEGPPEADALIAHAPDLEPPVALLAHVPGEPSRAAFWPFAVFSPEWQAILYGTSAGIPVRFCDLPAAHSLAEDPDAEPAGAPPSAPGERRGGGSAGAPSGGRAASPGGDVARDTGGGARVLREESAGTRDPREETAEAQDPPDRPAVHDGPEDAPLDPIGALAAAAGYDDPERWWEDVVEHRGGDTPFAVIAEAMAAVREGYRPDTREARREAYMRKTIRTALKQGFTRIAVVCGAWHAPALAEPFPPAAADNALLRGLPKVKAELTWVPWTYGRLASWSGYGAGITSPGWYHHLFQTRDRPIERWLAQAAEVLRDEGRAVSSAHVIESVRLADALAALRGRPLAGLGEVTEAARAVLCEGDDLAVELIQRRMVVGDRLGRVSGGVPMVPLQRDLRDRQRRLKLKPEAIDREIDLDLRKPLDLGRSHLLHRLRLLGAGWGTPGQARGKGTFRETWTLRWRPEHDLALIEHAALGTTVVAAAVRRARDLAASGPATLADLTGLVEQCLLADLPEALPDVLGALSAKAALDTDVTGLMAALPAMVRAHRYGDVRGTSAEGLGVIVRSMLERICVGLPVAVTGLDDDAAAGLLKHVDAVHSAVALLDAADAEALAGRAAGADADARIGQPIGADADARIGQSNGADADADAGQAIGADDGPRAGGPERAGAAGPDRAAADAAGAERGLAEAGGPERRMAGAAGPGPARGGGSRRDGVRGRWLGTLRAISDRQDLHGLIEGRLTRILLDAGELHDARGRMSRAMSRGQAPARAAAWVEGFLAGGGLLLVHDPRLLGLVDEWLTGLSREEFTGVLPLLRRTFGAFAAPERRAVGERLRAAGRDDGAGRHDVDERRAAPAVATVLSILGRPAPGRGRASDRGLEEGVRG